MLILKTVYGDFGNFKDLYRFMQEENLKEISIAADYIFSNFSNQVLTLEEVYNLSIK